MKFFVILTVTFPTPSGMPAQATITRLIDVAAGATRADVYEKARALLPAQAQGGNTAFFSAEPNDLAVAS